MASLGILPPFSKFHPLDLMGALFISLLTLGLILISGFIVLIVLMQRTSQSGGMGAALGGGAAESAFGADTNNVLTKGTIYGIIAYFVVALGLYLIYQARATEPTPEVDTTSLVSADAVEDAAESTEPVTTEGTDTVVEESVEGTPVETPAADVPEVTVEETVVPAAEEAVPATN